jgi:hypothetical protein
MAICDCRSGLDSVVADAFADFRKIALSKTD